jgi:hypothetical protein
VVKSEVGRGLPNHALLNSCVSLEELLSTHCHAIEGMLVLIACRQAVDRAARPVVIALGSHFRFARGVVCVRLHIHGRESVFDPRRLSGSTVETGHDLARHAEAYASPRTLAWQQNLVCRSSNAMAVIIL